MVWVVLVNAEGPACAEPLCGFPNDHKLAIQLRKQMPCFIFKLLLLFDMALYSYIILGDVK